MTESTKGDQPTVYDFAISYAAEGYGAFIDAMKNTVESFVANWNSEAIAEVEVTSATALSEEQLSKISAAMEKRLSRKVKLNCSMDASLMAGVLIKAGDLVIDGTVRGKLDRMADALQS